MLNMIKLDWLGMKYYQKRFVILPLALCLLGVFHEAFILPFAAFLMLSFSVNPFAVEEKGKLDNLYLTLPIQRKTVVNSRLSLSLIMLFVGQLIGTIITLILSKLLYGKTIFFMHGFRADFHSVFLLICSSLLLYSIMNLSTFPILFKIGYAKGRVLGFYIPIVGAVVIIYALYFLITLNSSFHKGALAALEWSLKNTMGAAFIILFIAALALGFSFILSHRFYAKREF